MPTSPAYSPDQPARSEVDAMKGWVLLDFGTDWCGHCQAARSATSDVLTRLSGFVHRRIEDGPGRALGRSFKVKLWPTWVLLHDGQEVARLVRPTQAQQAADFLSVCHTGPR
jgi:thioredoxin 1